ncbi:Protein cbp3, mitochondrial [Puccinia graminis f. sp. tritici]|uniref:Protein cbp3, mitochondrial n=1 Tax=Puccinia graminis f. sp. tritici TaxID=56615 RepID=A0A5B0SBJ2_PUCGR|nr:Protein cbp3, mitochondrial [Puccinia graminis f. sp. tritici]KAA1134553.1 Protein cbp3, mitochondrial [Puccinia graminis f. sp. tritici]
MARFITRTASRLISSTIDHQNNTPNQIRSAFLNTQHRQLIRLNSSSSAATTQTKPSIDQTNHVVGRSGKVYSHRTVKIVGAIGRLLGYTLQKSTAVTLTSDYYDRCAARFEIEKQFWVEECGLPDSFQTWFQVTQLHMWLITVRFRSMKAPLGKYYLQEFINHSFLDTEDRIRGPQNKITKGTLIKNYMKILLHQHRGFQTVLDWAISHDPELNQSDQFLAGVIWRNLFGAAWGKGMGGVKGIFDSKEEPPVNSSTSPLQLSSSPPSTTTSTAIEDEDSEQLHSLENDVKFPETLERLVIFIRKELVRLDQVTDKTIITGQTSTDQAGLTQFNKI